MTSEFQQLPARVMVVDDDRLTRELVRDSLPMLRIECCNSGRGRPGRSRPRAGGARDLRPHDARGLSGLELLQRVRREHPGTEFVLLTANASVESAVGALRMGAADYLVKPVRPEELSLLVVERILGRRRLLEENERLRDALRALDACQDLLRCLDATEIYAVGPRPAAQAQISAPARADALPSAPLCRWRTAWPSAASTSQKRAGLHARVARGREERRHSTR